MNPNKITYFAETDARNQRVRFGIKAKDRTKHVYVIGKTGMGKSTLLENMAIQDIQNGEGLAFVDPHGKTAELLLEYVPEERIKDVVYFAPFDMEYPISFNVMEDVGIDKRHLVASGLMSAFKKIWVDAWSARMEYILNNILLALLEYPEATILGVNRMLADKEYRKKVVDNISDVSVKAFWVDEFAKYGDRYMQEAGAAIQNKIGQFISNPLVRNIVGQPKSAFDVRDLMDKQKILIVNLSKGRVGEANANLLGSMLVTKIYLGAMSRADVSESTLNRLPNFYLYVDEFQSFANESFADILSEARKYKLNLTIAHQYIEQMSEEVRAAVFGNVGTMIAFRVGAFDAEVLEKEFAPEFTAEDMVNLGFTQVYLKLMIDGVTSKPFSGTTIPPIERQPVSFKDDCISYTRKTFAKPRKTIEGDIRDWSQTIKPELKAAPKRDFKDNKAISTATTVATATTGGGVIKSVLSKFDSKTRDSDKITTPKSSLDKNDFSSNGLDPDTKKISENPIRAQASPDVTLQGTHKDTLANNYASNHFINNIPQPKINPVSLESLKDKRNVDIKSAQGNKEDLRQALASMLKNKDSGKAISATENEKKSSIISNTQASGRENLIDQKDYSRLSNNNTNRYRKDDFLDTSMKSRRIDTSVYTKDNDRPQFSKNNSDEGQSKQVGFNQGESKNSGTDDDEWVPLRAVNKRSSVEHKDSHPGNKLGDSSSFGATQDQNSTQNNTTSSGSENIIGTQRDEVEYFVRGDNNLQKISTESTVSGAPVHDFDRSSHNSNEKKATIRASLPEVNDERIFENRKGGYKDRVSSNNIRSDFQSINSGGYDRQNVSSVKRESKGELGDSAIVKKSVEVFPIYAKVTKDEAGIDVTKENHDMSVSVTNTDSSNNGRINDFYREKVLQDVEEEKGKGNHSTSHNFSNSQNINSNSTSRDSLRNTGSISKHSVIVGTNTPSSNVSDKSNKNSEHVNSKNRKESISRSRIEKSDDPNLYQYHGDSLINVTVPNSSIAQKRSGVVHEVPEKTLRKMLYVKRPNRL